MDILNNLFRRENKNSVERQRELEITERGRETWLMYIRDAGVIIDKDDPNATTDFDNLVGKLKDFVDPLISDEAISNLELNRKFAINFYLLGMTRFLQNKSLKGTTGNMKISWNEEINIFETIDRAVGYSYMRILEDRLRGAIGKLKGLEMILEMDEIAKTPKPSEN